MQRVKTSTAVAILPADPGGGTPGYFANPNPGGGVPATVPNYEWYNNVQEELLAVIEGQSLAPSGSDRTQLRQAIAKMINAAQRAVVIDGVTFNAGVANGNAAYWDSANTRFDKALADGSAKQNCVGFADVTNSKLYAFGDAVLFSGLTPGSRYYLDGTTAGTITTVAPANAVFVGVAKSATEVFVDIDLQPAQTAALPEGYLTGLTIGNNGGNPNTQIDFAAGRARDTTNTYDLVLSAKTKTLQAAGAFAAGTGNNGLFSGAKANSTWYHCHVIRKTSDGSIDCGFDTSITAANIPAGYAGYRRVGSILTDGSGNIRAFFQARDEFWWATPIQDVNVSNLGTTVTNYTISAPPGIAVVADMHAYGGIGGGNADIYIKDPLAADLAPNDPPAGFATLANIQAVVETYAGGLVRVRTNTSSQITARSNLASTNFVVATRGWRDQL